jgi:hypothetical protein
LILEICKGGFNDFAIEKIEIDTGLNVLQQQNSYLFNQNLSGSDFKRGSFATDNGRMHIYINENSPNNYLIQNETSQGVIINDVYINSSTRAGFREENFIFGFSESDNFYKYFSFEQFLLPGDPVNPGDCSGCLIDIIKVRKDLSGFPCDIELQPQYDTIGFLPLQVDNSVLIQDSVGFKQAFPRIGIQRLSMNQFPFCGPPIDTCNQIAVSIQSVDTNLCIGDSRTFFTTSYMVEKYEWYLNNLLKDSTDVFNMQFDSLGVYKIKVRGYSENDICFAEDSINILVNPKPTFRIADTIVCKNDTIQINLPAYLNYEWDYSPFLSS